MCRSQNYRSHGIYHVSGWWLSLMQVTDDTDSSDIDYLFCINIYLLYLFIYGNTNWFIFLISNLWVNGQLSTDHLFFIFFQKYTYLFWLTSTWNYIILHPSTFVCTLLRELTEYWANDFFASKWENYNFTLNKCQKYVIRMHSAHNI